jgi:hypothetical protein
MSLDSELRRVAPDACRVLILDNEVTVGHFVTNPPLQWTRLARKGGVYRASDRYPTELTEAQAQFEMRNWDEVSLAGITEALRDLSDGADYIVFGNNAGQGLPLAASLPQNLTPRAAIIYARNLPEQREYEKFGYKIFFPRSETIAQLKRLAVHPGGLSLFFINTIQHNDSNYHDP